MTSRVTTSTHDDPTKFVASSCRPVREFFLLVDSGALAWNLLVNLKNGRQEVVWFGSQNEAEAALEALENQMRAAVGLTRISGLNTLLLDTASVETAQVYEAA